jgi:hypothetical protein
MHRSKQSSFDYLVGSVQEAVRHSAASEKWHATGRLFLSTRMMSALGQETFKVFGRGAYFQALKRLSGTGTA